jgi:hypothetical protein
MSADRTTRRPGDAAKQSAIQAGAAFIELVESMERGDFAHAGVAQRELRRLGFVVALRPRRPRQKKGGGR